ncbi:MAG: AAA family ATPase [Microscillaceae bacterium]|nr:AAA family ATPase [Microscillaceae bacterium]
MTQKTRPAHQFYGKYNIFDGNYFYESYYLLNSFDQKLIEFSVDDYFENNYLVNLDKFIAELKKHDLGEINLYRHNTSYNKKEQRYSVDWYLFIKNEQIIMNVNNDTIKKLTEINFRPHELLAIESIEVELLEKIFKIAEECQIETEDDHKRYINIVSSMPRDGLRLNKYEIKKPNIIDLDLYYGEGFHLKHQRFVDLIHRKDHSGLFIFHGLTGSGKTNYIRYLISQTHNETNFIFYPITLLREMADPQFITFISDYQNSVLIIEESEDTVQARDSFNTDKGSIANLLNISDGLLSDVLNLKIISTFNTDIRNLDKALLREGRLLGIHKFDKIPADHANRIAQMNKLGKIFTEPVTLAQIFNNPLKEDFSDFVVNEPKIGFK